MDEIIEKINEKLTSHTEQIKTLFVRCEKHEQKLDNINTHGTNIAVLTKILESVQSDLGEIKGKLDYDIGEISRRIEVLEKEPGRDFNHYKRLIIGGVFSTLVGFLIGRFLM